MTNVVGFLVDPLLTFERRFAPVAEEPEDVASPYWTIFCTACVVVVAVVRIVDEVLDGVVLRISRVVYCAYPLRGPVDA